MTFSINVMKINDEIDRISSYATEMKKIQQSVEKIRNCIDNSCFAMQQERNLILKIEEAILEEAVGMDSLSEALSKIVEHYLDTERSVSLGVGQVYSEQLNEEITSSEQEELLWQKVRSLLLSLGIIKPQKQERVEEQIVTDLQQKEMDLYLKKEIEKILKKKRFSKKTWKSADMEERKKILDEYLQEVAAVMGLKIDNIQYSYLEKEDDTYNMGSYSSSSNTVKINEWVLENGGKDGVKDSYYLMTTIVHEMRHAYQHAACDNPDQFVVTEETIQKWQESFDNYKSKSGFMKEGMDEKAAYKAYRDQIVESDARNFAK